MWRSMAEGHRGEILSAARARGPAAKAHPRLPRNGNSRLKQPLTAYSWRAPKRPESWRLSMNRCHISDCCINNRDSTFLDTTHWYFAKARPPATGLSARARKGHGGQATLYASRSAAYSASVLPAFQNRLSASSKTFSTAAASFNSPV